MKATIIITTKNRCDELRVALNSCIIQTGDPEILVIDDGSDDGTSGMVKAEFPQVRLITKDRSEGLIARRNLGAELATGDVIFSIDDDAEFSSPHVVEQTLADFDDPRIAVVAIPLVEPNYANRKMQWPPDSDGTWISYTFKGTAYAARRDLFFKVGGFWAELVHQGEENDLAIRLLDRGYVIRLGRADPIIHYESPKRDLRRMHFYGRRNDLLFAVRNVPAKYLPVHMVGTTINGLRYSFKAKQRSSMYSGLAKGWLDSFGADIGRSPVSAKAYKLYRKLKKQGEVQLDTFGSLDREGREGGGIPHADRL
jgi:glycosyltransferase involved in cell wall biosynthesis